MSLNLRASVPPNRSHSAYQVALAPAVALDRRQIWTPVGLLLPPRRGAHLDPGPEVGHLIDREQ
jgi:hypothetical protein